MRNKKIKVPSLFLFLLLFRFAELFLKKKKMADDEPASLIRNVILIHYARDQWFNTRLLSSIFHSKDSKDDATLSPVFGLTVPESMKDEFGLLTRTKMSPLFIIFQRGAHSEQFARELRNNNFTSILTSITQRWTWPEPIPPSISDYDTWWEKHRTMLIAFIQRLVMTARCFMFFVQAELGGTSMLLLSTRSPRSVTYKPLWDVVTVSFTPDPDGYIESIMSLRTIIEIVVANSAQLGNRLQDFLKTERNDNGDDELTHAIQVLNRFAVPSVPLIDPVDAIQNIEKYIPSLVEIFEPLVKAVFDNVPAVFSMLRLNNLIGPYDEYLLKKALLFTSFSLCFALGNWARASANNDLSRAETLKKLATDSFEETFKILCNRSNVIRGTAETQLGEYFAVAKKDFIFF